MLKPRNAFYQNLAQIERQQEAVAARLEAIGVTLPPPDTIPTAIGGLAEPIGALGEIVATRGADQAGAINRNAKAGEDAAHALKRLADSHHRLVRLLELERRPERRSNVSLLFLGVNVDGSFTRDSAPGKLLIDASGGASGLAMQPAPKGKQVTRDQFAEAGLRHAQANGFDMLSTEDFEEFFDQARHVLGAIQHRSPPSPGKGTTATPAAAPPTVKSGTPPVTKATAS